MTDDWWFMHWWHYIDERVYAKSNKGYSIIIGLVNFGEWLHGFFKIGLLVNNLSLAIYAFNCRKGICASLRWIWEEDFGNKGQQTHFWPRPRKSLVFFVNILFRFVSWFLHGRKRVDLDIRCTYDDDACFMTKDSCAQ